MPLNFGVNVSGSGSLIGTRVASVNRDSFDMSTAPWAAVALNLSDGTGNLQSNQWYVDQRTVAAGANDDIDLYGVLVNGVGQTVNLTSVKVVLAEIDTPDGVKSLTIGPGAVTNPWVGPFGGTNPTVNFNEVFLAANRWSGWAVNSTTAHKLRVTNPGATAVTYRIALVGTA